MARKKAEGGGGVSGGEWLNTYADMVTLLLTFFILLFSMSSLDSAKYNIFASAMKAKTSSTLVINGEPREDEDQTGPPYTEDSYENPLEAVYMALKEYFEDKNVSDSVAISKGENYLLIQFMNDMLFEPNSAVLRPSERELLNFVGSGIKSMQNECEEISIHGFTASVPSNPDYPVNEWILSAGRANAVLVYFDDVVGIDKTKMYATTWGMNQPFDTNDTPEGRARNRRVEILISTENLLAEQLDNIYEKLVE